MVGMKLDRVSSAEMLTVREAEMESRSDKITLARDWRDGSAVKSTGWPSIRSGFVFQHLHGNSQLV